MAGKSFEHPLIARSSSLLGLFGVWATTRMDTKRTDRDLEATKSFFAGSGVAGKGKAHAPALKNVMLGVAGRPRIDKLMYGF